MTKLIAKLKQYEIWFLRAAVAFPMLWAGLGALRNSQNWIGFVPSFITNTVTRGFFLAGHSVLLIIVATLIILGPARWRWLFALVAFGNLAGILLFYGVDDITFRDVGLTLAALVLFIMEHERHLSSVG